MINKKLFLLAGGYILGGLVASKYNKKTPDELDGDLKTARNEGKKDFDVYLDNFIETHKNLLDNFKTEIFSDSNKDLFNEKKAELLSLVDDYKIKGEELLGELKVKGSDYSVEIKDKLEVLYKEKIVELDRLKEDAPAKVEEIKDKLSKSFEGFKKDIENKIK